MLISVGSGRGIRTPDLRASWIVFVAVRDCSNCLAVYGLLNLRERGRVRTSSYSLVPNWSHEQDGGQVKRLHPCPFMVGGWSDIKVAYKIFKKNLVHAYVCIARENEQNIEK